MASIQPTTQDEHVVSQDTEQLFDIEKARREARESIENGAVTADYPLDLRKAHELLNQALAAEILCVLRYRHHQIVAKGIDSPQVAAEFAEHAQDEHEHMMMIAERIDQLGGNPDFNPSTVAQRAATEFGQGESLAEMIKEDLIAERVVIEIYRKMVQWFSEKDPTTRRMLEKVLEDEEDHANDLADLLASMRPETEYH